MQIATYGSATVWLTKPEVISVEVVTWMHSAPDCQWLLLSKYIDKSHAPFQSGEQGRIQIVNNNILQVSYLWC